MSEDPPIDRSALDRLEEWGGERLLYQMVRLFLDNSPERLTQIATGFEAGDIRVVERGSHSLKSSAANVGAREVSRIAHAMEHAAAEGDLEAARTHQEPLVQAHEAACRALREVQKGAPE